MAKGGSRPRSGPSADPNSGRSERARRAAKKTTESAGELPITAGEFSPTALPARGRTGNPPAFSLPKIVRFVMDRGAEGKSVKVASDRASDAFRKRELEIWRGEWKKPQAVAWEREPWRWERIALYCRLTAVIEAEPESNAALISRQRELAIEHGLTPDGMKANGWAIAPDQLAQQRARKATAPKAVQAEPTQRRLRS